jgi:hypothetical protein
MHARIYREQLLGWSAGVLFYLIKGPLLCGADMERERRPGTHA